MKITPQVSVILPVYNEEEGLQLVLDKLDEVIGSQKAGSNVSEWMEVVVIDDGSFDDTVRVASDYHCRLISHVKNLGKGQAMQTGIANSKGQNLIFIDADGTYPVGKIFQIIDKLRNYDIVFTVREKGNIPAIRLIGNRVIAGIIRILFGFTGRDPLSGMYGIRRATMEEMDMESSGFSVETEIAIKSAMGGFKVAEIPITYNRRTGASKLNILKDGVRIFRLILLFLFRKMVFGNIAGKH